MLMLGLVVVVAGFTWSFLSKSGDSKVRIPREDLSKLLAKSVYETKTGHRIKVEILNGCGIQGLATRYSDYLRSAGVDVISTGNADNYHYERTLIYHRRGDFSQAEEIAKLLGIPLTSVSEKPNPDLFLDETIIVGEDYLELKIYNKADSNDR